MTQSWSMMESVTAESGWELVVVVVVFVFWAGVVEMSLVTLGARTARVAVRSVESIVAVREFQCR